MKKKTVIVTGASSGIGAATARLLARSGVNVVLAARRKGQLQELSDEIERLGSRAVFLAGDVRDEVYAEELVQLAEDTFGALDAAFNNAGVMGDVTPVPEMSRENWSAVIGTNLTSAFYAAKYQIPAIERAGGGALLFTSSFVGAENAGLPGMGAYAASKAGLIGLVRSLSIEHGAKGVRVNALLPGGTRTDMAGDDPDVHRFIAGLHALNRMAEAEEIAEVAAFLMSDAASFVTGSAISADGGASIRFG